MEAYYRYNLKVIEDAAEAQGALYKKQKIGSLADAAMFSFFGNKIITTSGGGALISKNKDIKKPLIKVAF